jgi:peptidoglycan/xylan/chitin deacetylase (PgdA/CDA1 family)
MARLLLLAVLLLGAAPFPSTFVQPPILMYHRVDVDHPATAVGLDLTVRPSAFQAQMRYLAAHHIAIVSLAQMIARLREHRSLQRTVVVTFDDGYADQAKYALPILRKVGGHASFFIITSSLGLPNHLRWSDLRAMRAAGMDIGAHGVEHDDLSLMTAAEQRYQIDDCIAALHRWIGERVVSYAYPSGRLNATTLRLVQAAGIQSAVTTDPFYVLPPQNRFELTRIRVARTWSIAEFAAAVHSALAHGPTISARISPRI